MLKKIKSGILLKLSVLNSMNSITNLFLKLSHIPYIWAVYITLFVVVFKYVNTFFFQLTGVECHPLYYISNILANTFLLLGIIQIAIEIKRAGDKFKTNKLKLIFWTITYIFLEVVFLQLLIGYIPTVTNSHSCYL